MTVGKKIKSPLVAGFMAAAISLNSPAGHGALYQGMLRMWFMPEWLTAMHHMQTFMSFDEFRNHDMIQFWLYDSDFEIFEKRMSLIQSNVSFCLPRVEDDETPNDTPQNLSVCHAVNTRDKKKNLDPRLKVS